jgi:cytochrome c oxidase assembly protein subunit 15
MRHTFHRLAGLGAALALLVIVLGAWVRLSDAGLGCPDWPGCYGQLTWPNAPAEVELANQAFPERPVETHKAWKEMVHRYVAGALVLLVLALNRLAWRRESGVPAMRRSSLTLMILILLQAALGMWTVTLKLKPVIVMLHLMGGMTTLALLVWMWHRSGSTSGYSPGRQLRSLRRWIVVGLCVLSVQIALGGWTSANYAALVCPDLPTCMGEWWPESNFTEGFRLWREIGVDYEGGILDLPSRVAIHVTHRIGALLTLAVLLVIAGRMIQTAALQRLGVLLAGLVGLQFILGLMNIVLRLPLPNAVLHNGVAALLLAVLVTLLYRTSPNRT